MNSIKVPSQKAKPELPIAVQRGLLAAKTMSRALSAEHKRWGMPLLTWKNGRVVEVKAGH